MVRFYGVLFSNDRERDVVSGSWLEVPEIGAKTICRYPDQLEHVEVLAKQHSTPEPSWGSFPCEVFSSAGTYKKCWKRLNEGISVETAEEREVPKEKRVFVPKRTVPYISKQGMSSVRSTEEELEVENTGPISKRTAGHKQVTLLEPASSKQGRKNDSGDNCSLCEEVKAEIKQVGIRVEKAISALEELKEAVMSMRPNDLLEDVLPPAATTEELNLFAQKQRMLNVLSMQETSQMSGTIKKMLKRMMTKNLAVQYSYTGLGKKRQLIKKKFQGSPAYYFLHRARNLTRYRDASIDEIDKVIADVLRSARDWEGARSHKRKRDDIDVVTLDGVPSTSAQEGTQSRGITDAISGYSHPTMLLPSPNISRSDESTSSKYEGVRGGPIGFGAMSGYVPYTDPLAAQHSSQFHPAYASSYFPPATSSTKFMPPSETLGLPRTGYAPGIQSYDSTIERPYTIPIPPPSLMQQNNTATASPSTIGLPPNTTPAPPSSTVQQPNYPTPSSSPIAQPPKTTPGPHPSLLQQTNTATSSPSTIGLPPNATPAPPSSMVIQAAYTTPSPSPIDRPPSTTPPPFMGHPRCGVSSEELARASGNEGALRG